jgi:hypothetical protein
MWPSKNLSGLMFLAFFILNEQTNLDTPKNVTATVMNYTFLISQRALL